MHALSQERTGEMFVLSEALLYSFFPLIINYSTAFLPPLRFAAISILLASFALFFHLLFTHQLRSVLVPRALPFLLGVTLLVVIIPSILIYSGTAWTSGVNTALLLEVEVIFTVILMAIFFHEPITQRKFVGTLVMCAGVFSVLYNGSFSLSLGEGMIILGTLFYPFGNFCGKKALRIIPGTAVVFFRSLFGGTVLLIISLLFETSPLSLFSMLREYWYLFAINGLLIMTLSKILWYEGLLRIEISKAKTLSAIAPAMSLLLASFLFHETVRISQWIGCGLILFGILILTRNTSRLSPSLPLSL